MTSNYDIFISYRREGGYDTAKHLNDLLVRDGYRVSFDIDTLRSGDFDTQLLERIDQCKDFILIVDQHAFDRTLDPNFSPKNDWLRCELAYALKKGKNIVPIFLSGVTDFPINLPKDVVGVTKKNGPEYNKFYFNDFYKILKQRFLHSKRKQTKKYIIVFFIALLLIFVVIGTNNRITQNPQLNATETIESEVVHDKNSMQSANINSLDKNDDTYGVPPAPQYTKAKITVEKPDYFDEYGSACEMAANPCVGYIISSEETDDFLIMVTVQEANTRAQSKFYINTDRMCNADLSWLPYILAEGNKVKIDFFYEGNGGYQQVLSMESLPRQ